LLENNSTALITDSGSSIGSITSGKNSVTNGNGGGLYAADSSVILSNSANFRQNFASGDGGGVFLTNSAMTINNADIGYPSTDFTNYAKGSGGGVFAIHSTLRVENDGQVFRAYAEGMGGGICAVESIILFDNATLGSSSVMNYGNAAGMNGGGLYAFNCSSVFNNTEIIKNQSSTGGGLDFVYSNYFLATNSRIVGNKAIYGGGVDFFSTVGDITIDSCSISNNKAYVMGGGIIVGNQNTLNIRGYTEINYNIADDKGGGISLFQGASVDIFSDSYAPVIISDNIASNYGGGIYGFSGSSISCEGNIWIRRNHAQYGGGICISNDCSLDILPAGNFAATFMGNNAVYAGGGLFAMGSNVVANVKNVNFGLEGAGNSTTNSSPSIYGGGAVYISDSARFNAINCSFIDNVASNYGGAIFAGKNSEVNVISDFDSASSLPPNKFFNNHAAFVGATNYYVSFKNCTIADNLSNDVVSLTTPLIEMENCIVWGNQGEFALSNCAVQYSDIQGEWPGTGNITNNPIFADPGALDYQLQIGSECINNGMTIASITNDCIGNLRPIGTGYDMGAYELNTTPILNVMVPIFSVQSGSPYVVAPLSSNDVTFRFSPLTEFPYTNNITFTSDGGNVDVTLIGTGIPEPGFYLLFIIYQLLFIKFSSFKI